MSMTLKQIEEVKRMEQLRYSIGLAQVKDSGSFQSDEGEPMNFVKIQMGTIGRTLMVNDVELQKIAPYKGKFVSLEGKIEMEQKDKLFRVNFSIDKITEIKE